jgi:VWFA-related protein
MILGRLFKFSLLLVCAALLCLASYQVVIRTNVHMVEVSVIATDSKGLPVSGLGVSDFHVFDNGKEQTVASFEKIDSRAAPGQASLPPNTYSNRVGDAGAGLLGKEKQPQVLSMILLDAVNTKYRNQTVVRRAVADILAQIDPAERVAIYAFGDRFRIIHDFTSDRASLLAKLKAYHGEVTSGDDLLEELELDVFNQPPPPDPVQQKYFDQNRIVDTLGALEAIANYVRGMPGRKNLLWLSAAFPLEVGTAQRTIAPTIGYDGPPDTYRSFGPEMARTMAALNDANVSVYPIDARGLSQGTPQSRGRKTDDASINISTMNSIAAETGGVAYANRSDLARGVRMALDDSREVYVMTYYPKAISEDGAYHQIRVQTARPGVHLRFRRGYYATARDEDSSAGAVDRLARAVSSPLDSSEIGIRASVEPAGDDASALAVVIHVDPADLSLAHDSDRWTGSLRLQWLQTGATGERYEGPSRTVPVDLPQASYQNALEQGVRLELRIHRDPSAVALRVAVVDERGARVGSLSVPLPRQAAQPAAPSGK